MRTGDDPGAVFDALHRRGQIVIHASDVERTAALAEAGAAGDLVVADTREQVAEPQRRASATSDAPTATSDSATQVRDRSR